jgi:hypothetical protein
MALTNAEKQRRWREERNRKAAVLDHARPKDVAEGILAELGIDRTQKVLRALEKRVRAIKKDCPACGGTGFMTRRVELGPGMVWDHREACDCGPKAAAVMAPPPPPQDHSWSAEVTDRAGKRWRSGVRLRTKEEAEVYAEAHARDDVPGYVTAEVIRCDESCTGDFSITFPRRKGGRPTLNFAHGTCHLLGWHEVGAPAPISCGIGVAEPANNRT